MKNFAPALLESLTESLQDLLPIIAIIAFFQLVVLQQPIPDFGKILMGTLSVIAGLTLFVRGLKFGLFSLGENMAREFACKGSLFWVLLFAFALGFSATVAEPALIAVSEDAAEVAAVGGWISVTSEEKHE